MSEVTVKAFESWNMSLSTLFGKTPKIKMLCGNCTGYFSRRFDVYEVNRRFPRAVCPHCGVVNKVPMKIE